MQNRPDGNGIVFLRGECEDGKTMRMDSRPMCDDGGTLPFSPKK